MVMTHCDIKSPILSKVERSERLASPDYLRPIYVILLPDLIDIHSKFNAYKINKDLGGLEHLSFGFKAQTKKGKK